MQPLSICTKVQVDEHEGLSRRPQLDERGDWRAPLTVAVNDAW
jgi:hypothetical protein